MFPIECLYNDKDKKELKRIHDTRLHNSREGGHYFRGQYDCYLTIISRNSRDNKVRLPLIEDVICGLGNYTQLRRISYMRRVPSTGGSFGLNRHGKWDKNFFVHVDTPYILYSGTKGSLAFRQAGVRALGFKWSPDDDDD